MATNGICNFCKRDVGLKVFVNRYIFGRNLKKPDDIDIKENQKYLYDLNVQRDLIQNHLIPKPVDIPYANSYSNENSTQLSTLKSTAMAEKFYYSKNKNTMTVDDYGFLGSSLRKGFLYVYLKHINQWHEYKVSDNGFLKRINDLNYFEVDGDLSSNNLIESQEPCFDVQHRANALTIIIPKPLEATKVYFKYSENSWSKNTKKRNNSFSFYEKYMDCFDVSAFLNGSYEKGAFPIVNGITNFNVDTDYVIKNGNRKNLYADFNISKIEGDIQSPLSYLSGKNYEDIFSKMAKRSSKKEDSLLSTLNIGNKNSFISSCAKEDLEEALNDDKKLRILFGAIFTINDPIAEIMDISSHIANIIVDDSTYTEQEKTANIIETLKLHQMGINKESLYTLSEKIKNEEANTILEAFYSTDGAIISPSMLEAIKNEKLSPEQRQANEIIKKKKEQFEKNKEWENKYIGKINKSLFGESVTSLEKKKKNQIKIADDLDNLLRSLISTNYISDHLFFNTEKGNLSDLLVKLIIMNYILESLKGCPKSKAFYSLFMYRTNDANNYFLNTMALDSDAVRSKMNDAVNKFQINDHTSVATLPFADLLNSVLAFADEKLMNARVPFASMHELNGLITTQIANCISHILSYKPPAQFVSHPLVPALVTVATRSHVGFNEVKFKANNLADFNGKLRIYLRSVYNLMGVKNINDNVLGKMISDDPYWMKKFEKSAAYGKFLVPDIKFNQEYLNSLPKQYKDAYLYHQDVINGAVKKIQVLNTDVSEDHLSDPVQAKFYTSKVAVAGLQFWGCYAVLTDNKISGAEKVLRSGSAIAGVATAMLELIAMMNRVSQNALAKSSVARKINAFVLESTGDLTKQVPKIITENGVTATRTVTKIVPKVLIWRSVGLIGSTIGSCYDMYNGVDAFNHGERGYGIALFASGFAVLVGSGIIFFLASNPLGWLFILAGIIFALAAYFIKENEIIIWIRKCILTADDEIKKFPDYDVQTKELELIFK